MATSNPRSAPTVVPRITRRPRVSGVRTVALCLLALLSREVPAAQPLAAQQPVPVGALFSAPKVINLASGEPLRRGEFQYSIRHTFGPISEGVADLWGIDAGANIRLGFELGLSQRLSIVLARSSLDKVYEAGARAQLMRQHADGGAPVALGLQLTTGFTSLDDVALDGRPDFIGRTHVGLAVPISRRWSPRLSTVVVPMAAWFDDPQPGLRLQDPAQDRYWGVGTGVRWRLGRRLSATAQYLAAHQGNSEGWAHGVGLGAEVQTGGHVFQAFLTSTQAWNDAWLLAAPFGTRLSDLRIGFMVARSFDLF